MTDATGKNRRHRAESRVTRPAGEEQKHLDLAEQVSSWSARREAEGLHGGGAAEGTYPAVPDNLAETGLSQGYLADLLMKTLHTYGARTGRQLAESLRLPYSIVEDPLMWIRQRQLIEVRGSI